MGKLHEVIAVEGSKKAAFEKVVGGVRRTFADKAQNFLGSVKTLESFEDENENGVVQQLAITTTVPREIDFAAGFFEDYLDVVFQKECTNQQARASVEVDGKTIIEDAPVTFLLGLEQKLAALRALIADIPTLAAGVDWKPDPAHVMKHVWKTAEPAVTFKTKKGFKAFTLAPATKEHKEQVEKVPDDRTVGRYSTDQWSAMLTPAQKSNMLSRLDKLSEAVKVARMRGNDIEAVDRKVGSALTGYLFPLRDDTWEEGKESTA